ncbi:MAG: hypothetical protein ACR2IJ_04845 [Fluviibacter sp.]
MKKHSPPLGLIYEIGKTVRFRDLSGVVVGFDWIHGYALGYLVRVGSTTYGVPEAMVTELVTA